MVTAKTDNNVFLALRSIEGRWGDFRLRDVDIDIKQGEYVVLLGPSGCGKTTLVEILCGLRRPSQGQVLFDGVNVAHMSPAARRTGYVPQDYDLFPTMNVERNIMFGPQMRGHRGDVVEERFARLVEMLRLEKLLKRDVATLSGGEHQRVALARALMTDPDLLLLDEPVSALPESQRDRVCDELKKLHHELGITTIHVSHNLEEALRVADRLAVMDVGRMAQIGAPAEVLDKPASRFVAEFTRAQNIWPGTVQDGVLKIGGHALPHSAAANGEYWVVVRPERISICDSAQDSPIKGKVVEHTRSTHALMSKIDTGDLTIWLRDDAQTPINEDVTINIPPERISLILKTAND